MKTNTRINTDTAPVTTTIVIHGNRRPVLTVFRNIAVRAWLPLLLLIVWWFASAASTSPFVPSLAKILDAIRAGFAGGELTAAIGVSLVNLFGGFLIASAVGVVFGIVIGEFSRLRDVIDPFLHFFRSVPQTALVPLIIGIFGIGVWSKIYAIAFACVWPILLNTIDGIRGVDPSIRRTVRVYGVPRSLYFRRVLLPGAMPQIVAGLRVALPIGIVVMVVSEFFAANIGLGFYILQSSSRLQFTQVWAGVLLVGIIGYLLVLLFALFERWTLAWYFRSGAQ